ncbi:MFS transporter [Amycolatopsis vastitatis]|uniref:MFS transporter n=1 Tax=Amycolatopsis vastitatis TaxID=1905142 RepID=A0A229SUJ8_9PSEU|nr:MFS transporter [Amycolatopsis vastitatis]OXM62807.1 MFS transporter [Amycolatopsis vastitatis]
MTTPTGHTVTPLHRNRNYRLLWTGSAGAFLGLFALETAMPLLILGTWSSAALTSVFAAVQTTTTVLCGAPAGWLLDRYDRRKLLVLAETARAAALVTLALALWLGQLTIAHVITTAAVLGSMQTVGTARMLLVRASVPDEQLTAAVTGEEVRNNAAELAGPPLGGVLFALSPVLPLLAATALFMVSAGLTWLVRLPARAQSPAASGEVLKGLTAALRERTMRAAILVLMLINSVAWIAQLVTIVLLRQHGIAPWLVGLVVAGFATGALAGTVLVAPLQRRLGPGALLLVVGLAQVPTLAGLALPLGPLWAALMCLCFGLGLPQVRVLLDVLVIRQIPDERRGQALSGVFTLLSLSLPIGMIGAGMLMNYSTPRTTLLTLASILLLGVACATFSRSVRTARWPGKS